MILLAAGCTGKKQPAARPDLREQARELAKEQAPSVSVKVSGGPFEITDAAGRPVLVARIQQTEAEIPPGNPSAGPVTLREADLTLYKEGKPSLWLKAPLATWEAGLLTVPQPMRCGTVDGKLTLRGDRATWRAATDLLTVSPASGELRQPSRPAMRVQGPTATWQNGLLALPAGAVARAADRSSSMRSDRVRWRPATHSLEATGRVRMTQGRLEGAAERLLADTALRGFRLTGGRPRVTIHPQPAPLVARASSPRWRLSPPSPSFWGRGRGWGPASHPTSQFTGVAAPFASQDFSWDRPVIDGRGAPMTISHTPHIAAAWTLAALPLLAAQASARPSATVWDQGQRVVVEANDINYLDPRQPLRATGSVILTRGPDTLRADRVEVALEPPSAGRPTGARVARATGNVRLTSQAQQDQRLEATGAAATYWPATQKGTLTGGVKVTMTSPQLKEPAVLTGAAAELDLKQRVAEVTRTQTAQVTLRLQPKEAAPPVRLDADRVRIESAADRITATGSPVLASDQGTVRAQRIWFVIDPKVNDIRTVNAEGSVRVDSQDPKQGEFHATAQQAVLNRAENTVVLTGNVEGTHKRPGDPEPNELRGHELTYNLTTGGFRLASASETKARVTVQPKPKTAGPGK